MPQPPNIARADEAADRERYPPVPARRAGAVAAPTAGLHFDEAMLQSLRTLGAQSAFVTLHVGAGTFQLVRADALRDHRMHAEWLSVSEVFCVAFRVLLVGGGRVFVVGLLVV